MRRTIEERVARRIAREGTITGAAAAMDLSYSVAYGALGRYEDEVRSRCFIRKQGRGGGCRLTRAGRRRLS